MSGYAFFLLLFFFFFLLVHMVMPVLFEYVWLCQLRLSTYGRAALFEYVWLCLLCLSTYGYACFV